MIKNSHYTYDYFQPEEYHFSLDSVFLAQKVAEIISSRSPIERALDLCAGCGIIGLELSLFSSLNFKIDFLEVQELYLPFFKKNVEMIYPNEPEDRFTFLNLNYQCLNLPEHKEVYDLIVCNPPYFFKGEGLLSPSDFKNRCRFFLDSDFETLIKACNHSLKSGGSAFLLVRSGTHHGRIPIDEINRILGTTKNRSSAKIIDQIRGTDIIEIRKES